MVAISVDLACLDERGFGGWEFLGIGKWEVDEWYSKCRHRFLMRVSIFRVGARRQLLGIVSNRFYWYNLS